MVIKMLKYSINSLMLSEGFHDMTMLMKLRKQKKSELNIGASFNLMKNCLWNIY